jgi:hypothetical protein
VPIYETDRFRVRKSDGTYEYFHVTAIYVEPGQDLQAAAARFLRCQKEDLRDVLRELRGSGDLLVTDNGHTRVSERTGRKLPRDPRLTRRLRAERENGSIWFPRSYVLAGPRSRWDGHRPRATRKPRRGEAEATQKGRFLGAHRWT